MDWAGLLVERSSHRNINDFMTENIFKPLGIRDLTMSPSAEMIDRCYGLWQRNGNGELSPRNYLLSKPLNASNKDHVFYSGGAGLYGSVKEYASRYEPDHECDPIANVKSRTEILQALLNDGLSPNGNRILSSKSIEQMFTNHLVDQPQFARQPLPTAEPDLAYPAPELYPLCPSEKAQGWGLGGMITPSITGRSDGTMQWSGLSNIFWWCDREKGVAGIVGSQILPFADPKVVELWVRVEQSLYEALGD